MSATSDDDAKNRDHMKYFDTRVLVAMSEHGKFYEGWIFDSKTITVIVEKF
jgi:hypothetical protein